MIAGIFGGSGFVAPCTRVLSNSDLSRRFVHRTSDRSRSEVLCTHGGQPSELVQSPSENDNLAIQLTGNGASKDFSCLMGNILPDLEVISKGLCYPLYWYEPATEKAAQSGFSFDGGDGDDADQPVAELDSLTANSDDRDFEVVAEHVREAIEKNQPEGGLDRLHTFVNKFIRVTCEPHGITITRDKPLHSVFGEYVKALREGGHLESAMTERILKSSISVLEAFNDVRNNKSLAHDNPILNYEESLLIFNHVAASIRFIKALETKIKAQAKVAEQQAARFPWDESIPF